MTTAGSQYEKEPLVIGLAYDSIPHLPGSNTLGDKVVDKTCARVLTKKCNKNITIIVEEKLDGSHIRISNFNGIKGYVRSGYPLVSSRHNFLREAGRHIKSLGLEELPTNYVLLCEWMVKAHSIQYNLPHGPLVLLDVIDINNKKKRKRHEEVSELANKLNLPRPHVIHTGGALQTSNLDFTSHHGALGKAEGFVYRAYDKQEGFRFIAKYVRSDYTPGSLLDSEVRNSYL